MCVNTKTNQRNSLSFNTVACDCQDTAVCACCNTHAVSTVYADQGQSVVNSFRSLRVLLWGVQWCTGSFYIVLNSGSVLGLNPIKALVEGWFALK